MFDRGTSPTHLNTCPASKRTMKNCGKIVVKKSGARIRLRGPGGGSCARQFLGIWGGGGTNQQTSSTSVPHHPPQMEILRNNNGMVLLQAF